MENQIGYRKRYRIRRAMPTANSIVSGLPFEVVEREATLKGLTVDEFIKQFELVVEYDNFDGFRSRFEKIKAEAPADGTRAPARSRGDGR